jgi:hypothetical protein
MTLSERADSCLAALDDAGQATARRVFLRLVSFDGTPTGSPRQQPISALRAGDAPERFAETVRHLTQAQLIKIDGEEGAEEALVAIADEPLITSWPTLQGWIRTHGKPEQLRRQLEADAIEWRQGADQGHADVGLLDKDQLTELAIWLTTDAKRDIGMSTVAESFLTASHAATRRRWLPGRVTAGTFLAISLVLMFLATPIVLLFIVVLTAFMIHKFG